MQCLPPQPGKSQITFPPKALPLDSKDILGKLFCLILHKTEIDLPIQRTLLPTVTKLIMLVELFKIAFIKVLGLNYHHYHGKVAPYPPRPSHMHSCKTPFRVWVFCDAHKMRDVLTDQIDCSWEPALIKLGRQKYYYQLTSSET